MAELNTGDGGGHSKGKKKPHAKKQSTRIDMTPMVDLAFLLLTFFMLTTTFNKPQRMDISMPVPPDEQNEPTKVKENTVTILIGKDNKLFWYQGEFKNDPTQIVKTNYSKDGIRKTLIEKNNKTFDLVSKFEEEFDKKMSLATKEEEKEKIKQELKDTINYIKKDKTNEAVFCIIKAVEEAKYENVVNILDEMTICSMLNFALVDITDQEKKLIETL
jgi:biopolymer transport protein ExbD